VSLPAPPRVPGPSASHTDGWLTTHPLASRRPPGVRWRMAASLP